MSRTTTDTMDAPEELALDQIRIDGGTQIREEIDDGLVAEYAACMKAQEVFPPVIVLFDGAAHWLADGFHRYHAAKKAGLKTLRADIRNGNKEDALWVALGANRTNGARLTNADIKKACRVALGKFPSHSDNDIAKQIGVDHKTVGKHRKALEAAGKAAPAPVRTGADGREMNTENIGPAAPPPAAAPVAQAAKAAPPLVDRFGVAIPEIKSCREGLARADEVAALMREVSALKGKILGLLNEKDPIYSVVDRSIVDADLTEVYGQLKNAKPYAVCPHCGGGDRGALKRCSACSGNGWLSEFGYRRVPKELKP